MSAAIILAAGLGTRLRPLTDRLPKPLVPVGDEPAIAHIQRWMAAHGVERVVVNTHHLAQAFSGIPLPLPTSIVHEPEILGTAGGVAGMRSRVDASRPLLVWNGDILADVDVGALLGALREGDAVAAWAVAPRPRGEGTVGLDERGRVVRLRHVRRGEEARGGDFLGVQALSPGLLPGLPRVGCMVGDVLAPALERGARIATIDHAGPWDDIGSIASYLAANSRWLRRRGLDAYVADGATVAEGVTLDQAIVGRGAVVDGRGSLTRCVLWPGAHATAPLTEQVVI